MRPFLLKVNSDSRGTKTATLHYSSSPSAYRTMAHAVSPLASSMFFSRKLSLSLSPVYLYLPRCVNWSSYFALVSVNGNEFQASSSIAVTFSSGIRVNIGLIPDSFPAPSQGKDSVFVARSQAEDTAVFLKSLKINLHHPVTHGRKTARYFPKPYAF